MEEKYELMMLFGEPVLYCDWRIPNEEVPCGLHKYEIQHDDEGNMSQIRNSILIDFMGTVLSKKAIEDQTIDGTVYSTACGIPLSIEDYNYVGSFHTAKEYNESYAVLIGETKEPWELPEDKHSKLSACTTACRLMVILDSIEDAEFVDKVIGYVSSNDAFSLGQLAAEFI